MNFLRLCVYISFASLVSMGGVSAQATKSRDVPSVLNDSQPNYVLGPGDQVRIYQPNAEDLDGREVRLDNSGGATFPVIGTIKLGGLTVKQSEDLIRQQLLRILIKPQPVIVVTDYKSQPVSVLGAVNNPGVFQLQGRKSLLDVITLAGGLRPDAGNSVKVTRRASAGVGASSAISQGEDSRDAVTELDLLKLMKDGQGDINIQPHDSVYVSKVEMIFVEGEVRKPGGFPLGTEQSLSGLQAVALAEGLGPNALSKHAKVIRRRENSSQPEVLDFDFSQVLKGKAPDVQLRAKDVLFFPTSSGKKAGNRATEAIIQAMTGIAVWGRL